MKRRCRGPIRVALAAALGITLLVASPYGSAAEDAEALLAAGSYREAAEAVRQRVDHATDDGHDWHVLADAKAALGETSDALAAYGRALPGDADHRLQIEVAMTRILSLQGKSRDAAQRLQRVLKVYESDAQAFSSSEVAAAAEAARLLGREDPARYRLALRLYEQAIARDPGNLAARVALADLFLDKYNNTEALALYREVLAIDEQYPPAMLGLARSHYFDHSETAVQAVRQALEVQPTLVPARVLLARMLIEIDQYAAAQEELERALEINPGSPEALTMKLVLRYLLSDRLGFDILLARLRELAPGYHEMYATLAEMVAQNRLYADAVDFAREAVARYPTFWRAHGLLGLNRLRLGEIDAGRRSLEQAFRGDPFNVWIKNTLDLLDRLGEFTTLRQGRFILAADARDAELLAPHLFPLAEAAYDEFAERYGHEPPTPVRIEVYPRHEDFSVRTVGLVGVDILGVSFGPTVAFDSPSAVPFGSVNWGSVLWHELAHTFHLSLSGSRVPRWFTEGLAVVEEHRARLGWGTDVDPSFLEAYQQGRLPPASRLNEAFIRPRYPRQVVHAYFQGALLLGYIEERYGIEAIKAMLIGYGKGLPTESILAANLDVPPDTLDREFDAYVRTRFAHALEAIGTAQPEEGAHATVLVPNTGASFRSLWREGGEALKAGDLERAETALREAKRQFPEFAGKHSPYNLLAQVYLQRGDDAAAIAELEAVVDIDADNLDAHQQLADLYLASGNPDAAAGISER
ncbi:MAG: tetratricopeptide repeat protein, partial [Gammaproteobacteria bacterium]|nr:tetratricopeptide repeat protein [Gammaproteobacteria bacterium]